MLLSQLFQYYVQLNIGVRDKQIIPFRFTQCPIWKQGCTSILEQNSILLHKICCKKCFIIFSLLKDKI